ncbi:MtrAB system histidine kinase MtrB [Microlunatus soli]|uniref:Sensor histidine kinase MtrB n=1 Tax=Microlunatus soli TaxID=630515 RepID=A0A1H1N014_9ACTN|nr:MtrAB system histidine kinase MtrB [Microlunatus soli]SDR92336.1 two-component system, OmpR family, sensor histidine kinase MtrB [Microlunatus soli]
MSEANTRADPVADVPVTGSVVTGPALTATASAGGEPDRPSRRWWRLPVDAWQQSLPLRVVATTFIASVVVMVLGGVLLMQQAAIGVLDAKSRAATGQAQQAARTAQSRLDALNVDSDTGPNELLEGILTDISDRNSSANSSTYYVILESQIGTQKSGNVVESSVPQNLRDQVRASKGADPPLWKAPTTVHTTGGPDVPGLAFGTTLSVGGVPSYQVYIIFRMEQEADTLRALQQAVLITGAVLVFLLTFIAGMVSRQVVSPIRAARRAAERLASGNLEDRMTVKGKDDLARLAISMNYMASELQKQITQLEELSRVQQRFVTDVSHELRTPLTTVRMAAEMLYEAREDFDPLAARSAELLQVELDRFESLLSDLLEISRFDAGAAVLTPAPTDLNELVDRVLGGIASLSASTNTEIRVHSSGPITAELDSRRIERVLRNLVVNAIEHGEHRPIDIHLAGDDDAVAIAVRDHGVGFEAAQAKQVFHRFWRADPSRERRIGGTGLGLSISMEDTRLHGGWLNAWGRPGRGAQFRVTLPRQAGAILQQSPLPLVPRDLISPLPMPSPSEPEPDPADDEARNTAGVGAGLVPDSDRSRDGTGRPTPIEQTRGEELR